MSGILKGEREAHLLAAVAAAILGAQGSPVWTRTAEALLLEDQEVRRRFLIAKRELDALLRES